MRVRNDIKTSLIARHPELGSFPWAIQIVSRVATPTTFRVLEQVNFATSELVSLPSIFGDIYSIETNRKFMRY